MREIWRKNRKKRENDSLVKYVHLTSKEVSLRLALEHVGFDRSKLPLPEWYAGLESIKQQRDKYFLSNLVILLGLIFASIGAIDNFSILNVTVSKKFIFPALLIFYSFSCLILSYFCLKLSHHENLFSSFYELSDRTEKLDLLMRYPNAFSAFQYNPFLMPSPKYMYQDDENPVLFYLFLIILMSGIFTLSTIIIITIVKVTSDIQIFHKGSIDLFSMYAIILSWSALIASVLLNFGGKSRTFTHHGLVYLLNQHEENDEKYLRAVRRIQLAKNGDA